MTSRKVFTRVVLFGLAVTSLLVGTVAPGGVSNVAAQQDCRTIGQFEVCGRFLQEWNKQGSEQASIYVNGVPITPRRAEISLSDGKVYEVQWFERARYEAHPGNQAPYDVLLGLLGTNLAEGRGSADPVTRKVRNPADQPFVPIDKPADANGREKVWFQETRHSISGKILEYWKNYGGIAQFGFPLSEQFDEVSVTDGKTYTVQYFQRNRFELHPEKTAPYEVELGLLGVQQYRLTPVPGEQLPTAPPKNMGTTRDVAFVGFSQEPANLVGWAQDSYVASAVIDAVDDGLVGQDHNGNYHPEDAYYLPTLENGGSYFVGIGDDRHLVTKYKIRRGLKWSDGTELTSHDAVFSFKLLTDPNTPVLDRTIWQKIATIDQPDKYTIIYNWLSPKQASDLWQKATDKRQYAYLQPYLEAKQPVTHPNYYAVGTIHPRHVLQNVPFDTISYSSYAQAGHIGSGPYRIERWVPAQQIDLVPNEHYALTDPPILKRIIIRFISDPTQLLGLLRVGDLDAATGEGFTAPSEGLEQLAGVQTVDYVPGLRWERIDFDLGSPVLRDKAVREAIITGINRQKIVNDTLRGKGTVLHTPLPPASPLSMQNPAFAQQWTDKLKLPQYAYDVAKANAILDGAGWVKGPDGVRAKGGERLELKYVVVGTNRPREAAAAQVEADLEALGIRVEVKKVTSTCPDCNGETCDLCAYASVLGNYADFSDWYTPNVVADEVAKGRLVAYRRYSSADLDPQLQQFALEAGRSKQGELAANIQVKLMNEVALVPLYVRPHIEVHRTTLANWKTSAGKVTPFFNVGQWHFK
ncbi:MAG: peptide ABC transporter substrate-binding protein [Chloroflexota bacterium]|nr:peptide ABC transporter substrate-binding protein [Chloroflexota bacterium]MDQ5866150.1 peptide ABC transporter substrate-binding protein [Chloroflexota bacterium]